MGRYLVSTSVALPVEAAYRSKLQCVGWNSEVVMTGDGGAGDVE